MEFPTDLWVNNRDADRAAELADFFSKEPLILTDELANSIFLNGPAEDLFEERGEALVNRLVFSLLGFDKKEVLPDGLTKSILGEAGPWKGMINVGTESDPNIRLVQTSAVAKDDHFVCGVVRLSSKKATIQ